MASSATPRQLARQPAEQRRLLLRAPRGGERARLGQQQPPRLEDLAHERRVERAALGDRVHEHVEPALRPPVAHEHPVAVPGLDEPQLLEPLDALADRGHVDAELRRERPLGR